MDPIKDGGPAFPTAMGEGMSLRDYFATHAPPPPDWWIHSYADRANDLDSVANVIAQWNYAYADAMLRERER